MEPRHELQGTSTRHPDWGGALSWRSLIGASLGDSLSKPEVKLEVKPDLVKSAAFSSSLRNATAIELVSYHTHSHATRPQWTNPWELPTTSRLCTGTKRQLLSISFPPTSEITNDQSTFHVPRHVAHTSPAARRTVRALHQDHMHPLSGDPATDHHTANNGAKTTRSASSPDR